jgi:hypothetical protein
MEYLPTASAGRYLVTSQTTAGKSLIQKAEEAHGMAAREQ